MKSKLKFYTLEAVDKEVARLEETLAHTTMSLNEEKKIVTTIKDLGKSRDAVRQYAEAQAKASGDDGSRRAIIERLRAKDAEIDAVKAEQGVVRAALDATRSKEEKAGADIPKMQEERNACYEVIKAKREKIRALRADFKKTQDEYWERERLWRSLLPEGNARLDCALLAAESHGLGASRISGCIYQARGVRGAPPA